MPHISEMKASSQAVLVTGAGKGIGEAVMERLAERMAQRERVWWFARTLGTTVAALAGAGAGAMRLLPYLK